MSDAATDPETIDDAGPWLRWTERLLLGALLALVAGVWYGGVQRLTYDYDEVLRAHSVWLVAQGERPYEDFLDVHPPYFFLLTPLTALLSGDADPVFPYLTALRLTAAVGNVLLLAGLVALAAHAGGPAALRRRLAVVAAGLATVPSLSLMIEFRMDGWGYAIMVWALWHDLRAPRPDGRTGTLGLATGVAAFFFSPKIVVLPPLIVAVRVFQESPRPFPELLLAAAKFAFGFGCAGSLLLVTLWWEGIGLDLYTTLLFRYHATANAANAYGYGLAKMVGFLPTVWSILAAACVAVALDCLRRRRLPPPLWSGVLAWSASQLLLVSYPYKQYTGSWILFATLLTMPAWDWLMRSCRRLGPMAFATFVVLACLQVAGLGRAVLRSDDAGRERRVMAWLRRLAPPGEPVVASYPIHPVARRSTFWFRMNTSDMGGRDSEWLLGRFPATRDRVGSARYRQALAERPPALVVVDDYPEQLAEALREHLGGYALLSYQGQDVLLRPDLAAALRRDQVRR